MVEIGKTVRVCKRERSGDGGLLNPGPIFGQFVDWPCKYIQSPTPHDVDIQWSNTLGKGVFQDISLFNPPTGLCSNEPHFTDEEVSGVFSIGPFSEYDF